MERSGQPIGACFLTPHSPVFYLHSQFSYFSLFIFSIFFVFYFSVFQCFLLFLLLVVVVIYCARLRPFYTACHDKIYHFTYQLFLACYGCPSLATHWSTDCLATTTTLCQLRHIPFPNKGNFVLFSCLQQHPHPDKGWVFSLTNSYGMHLVILAHIFFFWVICHPSKTFPPKKLERESQNRFPHSPYCQIISSLTSDPQSIAPILARYK